MMAETYITANGNRRVALTTIRNGYISTVLEPDGMYYTSVKQDDRWPVYGIYDAEYADAVITHGKLTTEYS